MIARSFLSAALTAALCLGMAGLASAPAANAADDDDAGGAPSMLPQPPSHYAVLNIASYHLGTKANGERYNEINPGFGYEGRGRCMETAFGTICPTVTTGFFHNSIERISVYGGIGLEDCAGMRSAFSVCTGFHAGVVTGYRLMNPAPAFLWYVKGEHNDSGTFAKVGFIPPVDGMTPPVFTLQLGKSFDFLFR